MLKRVQEFLKERDVEEEIYSNIGYLVPGGSDIFGTNNKDSDTDVRGIVLLDEDYLIGLKEFSHLKKAEGEGKINLKDDLDIELFSLKHFFQQAVVGYVVPMEMMFLKEEQIVTKSSMLNELFKEKNMFLSKKVVHNYLAMNKEFVYTYNMDRKKVRNPLSAERIEKFGYETKHASKALQHFYVLKQLMQTGEMEFYRKEREYLLEVKEGKHPLAHVTKEIQELKVEVDDLLLKTELPATVDFQKANQLYKNTVFQTLEKVDG